MVRPLKFIPEPRIRGLGIRAVEFMKPQGFHLGTLQVEYPNSMVLERIHDGHQRHEPDMFTKAYPSILFAISHEALGRDWLPLQQRRPFPTHDNLRLILKVLHDPKHLAAYGILVCIGLAGFWQSGSPIS